MKNTFRLPSFAVSSSWSYCRIGKVDSPGLKINGLRIHFFAVRGSLALELLQKNTQVTAHKVGERLLRPAVFQSLLMFEICQLPLLLTRCSYNLSLSLNAAT